VPFGDAISDDYWGLKYRDFTFEIDRHSHEKRYRKFLPLVPIVAVLAIIVIIFIGMKIFPNLFSRPTTVAETDLLPTQEVSSSILSNDAGEQVPKQITDAEQRQLELEKFKSEHPVLDLPITRVLQCSYIGGLAPFEIRTIDTGFHFFIKLENIASNKEVLTAFIRSGESLKTKVPLGNYMLKYAIGKEWYGEENKFGPEPLTQYFKADDVFEFIENKKRISGWTVELYEQPGGNLDVDQIPMDQF
jgi:hypothetical protein